MYTDDTIIFYQRKDNRDVENVLSKEFANGLLIISHTRTYDHNIAKQFYIEQYLGCYLNANLKEKAQLIFFCNPLKSSTSRVCITFLQITQKILTKDIIHWLKLITEILNFLQIFRVRKTTIQLF